MKLILLSDELVRLDPIPGPLIIEAVADDLSYSPFHMMAGALAYCTLSVLYAWGEAAKLDMDDLTVEVAWTFADAPHRVGSYDIRFNWPALPENRLSAAERVVSLCTIHETFAHPPTVRTVGTIGPPVVSERYQADGAEPVTTS